MLDQVRREIGQRLLFLATCAFQGFLCLNSPYSNAKFSSRTGASYVSATAAAFYKFYGDDNEQHFISSVKSVTATSGVPSGSSRLLAFQASSLPSSISGAVGAATGPASGANNSTSSTRPRILLTNRGRSLAFHRTTPPPPPVATATTTTATVALIKREDYGSHFDDPLLSSSVLPQSSSHSSHPPPMHSKANRKQNLFPPSMPPSSDKSTEDENDPVVGSLGALEDDAESNNGECERGMEDGFVCGLPLSSSNSNSSAAFGVIRKGRRRKRRVSRRNGRRAVANESTTSVSLPLRKPAPTSSPYFTRSSVVAANQRLRQGRRRRRKRGGVTPQSTQLRLRKQSIRRRTG